MASPSAKPEYLPISSYGIIGNLHTIALVSNKGSIDYLPFNRIDSPTLFTALLDKNKGGFFEISCTEKSVNTGQMYLPKTNILLTRFLAQHGVAELTDFMPVKAHEEQCVIFRQLKSVRGSQEFSLKCFPVFEYARELPKIKRVKEGILFENPAKGQSDMILITRQNLKLNIEESGVSAIFRLQEGESANFIFKSVVENDDSLDFDFHLENNITYWEEWSQKSRYRGPWLDDVSRSLLVLKLLCSYHYGTVVAAATFSLPENEGGERNWDYRYLWIRDAAFTMYAFIRMGYLEEAGHFMQWVKSKDILKNLQLMYRVDGSGNLEETTLDHLEGYKKSSPVRIGNAAAGQFQLDIYGELIDTIYLYVKYAGSINFSFWKDIKEQISYVSEHWEQPDHSIWEMRSGKKEFLHSRLLCWVALDRGIKIADITSYPADTEKWKKSRDAIFQDIYDNFWDEEIGAFVQYKGAKIVDSAALLMPILRFCTTTEPQWVSTFEKIEQNLVTAPLVYRYKTSEYLNTDGLRGTEATFTICSFWYIECLAKMGRVKEARLNFEKMLGYASNLGLFSEQIAMNGVMTGNFPQAFSHLALISAAYQINLRLNEKEKLKYD